MSRIFQFWRTIRHPVRAREPARARSLWREREEDLRARFDAIARQRAAARGIRWSPIDWGRQVVFARERTTGLLTAMAGFTVHFEAEDLLDDNEMATTPREATAIFHFQRGAWGTGGKTLFNMSPELALARLSDQFDALGD